jgi:hypothetical protein
MGQAQPKAKREDTMPQAEAKELIYKPNTHPSITPRGAITNTIQVLGKAIALASSATYLLRIWILHRPPQRKTN